MVPDIDLAWRRGIRPEPPIPVSDWADRHRILPPTSAEPGRWRTDRTPYLRVNRPGFTGGQNSRRIACYGTDTEEEDLEAVFP